jgi:hypothetical protein
MLVNKKLMINFVPSPMKMMERWQFLHLF